MLHEFLEANRTEILALTWERVADRRYPQPPSGTVQVGVEQFLDDLIATLRTGIDRSASINRDATLHGERLHRHGYVAAQVVHGYGDVCQVVTQVAIAADAKISVDEFKTLNWCLDEAIAFAVTEHGRQRELSSSQAETDRLGALAHELRNALHTADLAYTVLKTGKVAIGGSTGDVLGRSLTTMRSLVDRALMQVRLEAGVVTRAAIEVSSFIAEAEVAGDLAALERGVFLSVAPGEAGICVDGDRLLLGSAVSNLLQNAFRFTRSGGTVTLSATAGADHVAIEIADECGGLDPAQLAALVDGSSRRDAASAGLGLGLRITRQAIEAMGGTLSARNRPSVGCVLVLDLPRSRDPEPATSSRDGR